MESIPIMLDTRAPPSHDTTIIDRFPRPTPDVSDTFGDQEYARKRSGVQNFSREGWDEQKCRNVLVRQCSYVPRNYPYGDGVQKVFLVLRDHFGDENLDLAGGVLYELIEIDCHFTCDPGAPFQRWRRDHMRRYDDFSLPHVPHMTTITPTIRPTSKLVLWRDQHAERYTIRLSDSSRHAALDPSCVRTRKAWMIEHTMYVSSKDGGTYAVQNPNPREFHEMEWNSGYGRGGRLVSERDFDPRAEPDLVEPDPQEGTAPPKKSFRDIARPHIGSLKAASSPYTPTRNRVVLKRASPPKSKKISPRRPYSMVEFLNPKSQRKSWFTNLFGLESVMSLKEFLDSLNHPIPFPEGCTIPHAIFARKFRLLPNDEPLPPFMVGRFEQPTAETKALDLVAEAAVCGMLDAEPSWHFRGPFTPDLGFDGGLDYNWGNEEILLPTVFRRSCDASPTQSKGAATSSAERNASLLTPRRCASHPREWGVSPKRIAANKTYIL